MLHTFFTPTVPVPSISSTAWRYRSSAETGIVGSAGTCSAIHPPGLVTPIASMKRAAEKSLEITQLFMKCIGRRLAKNWGVSWPNHSRKRAPAMPFSRNSS